LSELTTSLKTGGLLTTAQNLMQTIGATLQRMKKTEGDVVSLGNGQWGLTEWYPGLRREKIEATAKPKQTRKRLPSKGKKKETSQAEMKETDAPKASKLSPEQIERMRALQADGKTVGQIAKELGIHQFNVYRVLKPKKPEEAMERSA
jgi:hypothetical protein